MFKLTLSVEVPSESPLVEAMKLPFDGAFLPLIQQVLQALLAKWLATTLAPTT